MSWVIRLNGTDERLDCASAIPLIGDFSIEIENFKVTASTTGSDIQAFIGSLTSFEDFIGVRASDWIIRIDNNTYTIPFSAVPEPLTRASLLIDRIGNQLTLQHDASSSTITVTTNNFVIGCFGVINASTPVATHFFGGDLGNITIDAAYLFDVDNSDHSGSTNQPIITDTIGGNDATGVNFPAFDPSVWVFVGTPPTTTYIRFNKKIIGADMAYKQGVAVANFPFTMRDSSNDPVTSGTTTGVMVTNGVASSTLANASYIGNNFWNISFTASEMNGDDQVAFTPVNASAVVEEFILKTYTELDSNLSQVNGVAVSSVDDFKADVSALATAANLQAVDDNVDAVLVDTNELQLNQGNWLTADVSALATTAQLNDRTLTGASYATAANQTTINDNVLTRLATTSYTAPDNASIAAILADTNELQLNQGNWVTATGFSTFNPVADQVIVATNNDKSGYSISGIKQTLDALQDVAKTDIVSSGPITTNAGVVSSDIKKINNVAITGNGGDTPFDT